MAGKPVEKFAHRIIRDRTMWIVALLFIITASGSALVEVVRCWLNNRDIAWRLIVSAPNHFWFLIVFFPMLSLCAAFIVVGVIRHSEEIFLDGGRTFSQAMITHWRVVVLAGLAVASLICVIDYYFNPKTFDKLRPELRPRAFRVVDTLRREAEKLPAQEQVERRRLHMSNGREELEEATPRLQARQFPIWDLTPSAQLYAYTSGTAQLRLRLLDPISHTLQLIALFSVVFAGWCVLWGWFICLLSPDLLKGDGVVASTSGAVLVSILLFAVWVMLYSVVKLEIQQVMDAGPGSGQRVLDIIVMVFLVAMAVMMGRTKLTEHFPVRAEMSAAFLIGLMTFVMRVGDIRTTLGPNGNPATFIIISLLS